MIMVLVLFTMARMLGGKPPGELSRRQRRRMAPAWTAAPTPTSTPTARPASHVVLVAGPDPEGEVS